MAKKKAERQRIKKEIEAVSKKRDAYLANETKKRGKKAQSEFDEAVMDALHEQAGRVGIAF